MKLKDFFFPPSLLMSLKMCLSMLQFQRTPQRLCHTNMCDIASTLNLGTDKGLSTAAKVSKWA